MLTRTSRILLGLTLLFGRIGVADDGLVFQERDGLVAVEAEHFEKQSATEKRAFHLTSKGTTPTITPDGDPNHVAGASGGAYLEILPDTRRTHADKLIRGTNFSPEPGAMAVLQYRVNFQTPGRYYVWVRAYSTGSEDNGLHVGLDGKWPESGQRMQWCEGKNGWRWESKQRTEQQHCGEPHKIYLDIENAGEHTIHFSMREDGFEFDKWLLTSDRNFARPGDVGPETHLASGKLPPAFEFVPADAPSQAGESPAAVAVLPAVDFSIDGSGYYVDRNKWLAINPEERKQAKASKTFPFPTGNYRLTLKTVGESDGQSRYSLKVDDDLIGDFEAPLSAEMYEEGTAFNKDFGNVLITEGAVITVESSVGSIDGEEFSRARWAAVAFAPGDAKTRTQLIAFLKQQTPTPAPQVAKGSPTKPVSDLPQMEPRNADGRGNVEITGETKQWHKVTLTLDGPYAHEQDNEPNPFTDLCMSVEFKHSGGATYTVPGYFAADGNAANSSVESGTKWRAHFAPDLTGEWTYQIRFVRGKHAALDGQAESVPVAPYDGKQGTLSIAASDKRGRDLRAHGRLNYVGKHYLQFAGSGQYFLKAGADAPETLLGYADFDGTQAGKPSKVPLKTFAPHVRDWSEGNPSWKDGKGKGLIGAVNYLSGKGCNAFSFLTYNAGGDGDNVWPFIQRDDKLHYDCSKLDQWGIVFDHGTARGMYLHFKLQETENDDHRTGTKGNGYVPTSLDGGDLGIQRKLYCRELIARFAHNLALNWNIGEENTQSTEQQKAMIDYIAELDAYDHNIVIHTFPDQQDKVYKPLLGPDSNLTGASLQNSGIKDTHWQTLKWVQASTAAGKPLVVAFDESGTAAHGQCPDLGFDGYDGHDRSGKMTYTEHEVRQQTLWGTLMAGGAGVEYYFGYQYAENDLVCENWRSRDRSWDYCRIALDFFHDNKIPFWEMSCNNDLIGNSKNTNDRYCLAAKGQLYVIYLANGKATNLDLTGVAGDFDVQWFNPRHGGELQSGSVTKVSGGSSVSIGTPPAESEPDRPNARDWVVVVRK